MKKVIRNKFLVSSLRDVNKFRKLLQTKPEDFWCKRGKKMVSALFKDMKKNVPGFSKFLKLNGVKPIDKDNYLRLNELKDLCWDGDLGKVSGTISATSGSTGQPFYFPRSNEQDLFYSLTAELYLLENFQIDKKSTLYIDAFAMGPWIGGVFTFKAIDLIQQRTNYKLNMITPGISKKDILDAIKNLGDKFDQIIIGSYAPFLKDVLDEGVLAGLDWKKYKVKFVFSAEGFSEDFRKYVYNLVGVKEENNYFLDSLNHYGTVDMGTMSYETPICILLRQLALEKKEFYKDLLRVEHKLPTLTQFLPEHFYFEEDKGKIICSSYSGLPLYKYDLKDNGGVVSFKEVDKMCKKYFGKNIKELSKQYGIEKSLWQLPFVFVYERADFSVKLFGFEVFPETIRRALIKNKNIYKNLTGKFTIETVLDEQMNQALKINIELKKSVCENENFKTEIEDICLKYLCDEIIPYKNTHKEKNGALIPKIVLHPYESQGYFKTGGKHKWVKKN